MSDLIAITSTLVMAVAGTLLLLFPGLLAADCFLPTLDLQRDDPHGDDGLERVALMLAWGFGLVPSFAFVVFLTTGLYMSWPMLAGVAALNSIAIVAWQRRRGDHQAMARSLALLANTARQHRGLLLASLAVGVLYALRHDESLPALSCLHHAALKAVGPGLRGGDLLRDAVYDVRLGNVGVVAGFDALMSGLAYQWLFGLCGSLLAFGGFLLGARTGGSRGWGWLGLVALALNPWSLSFPRIDENLLTMAFSAVTLPLILRRHTSWLVVGALVGLLVTMRHVLVLALPAVLWLAASSPRRQRALLRLTAGFLLMTALEMLHHKLALGSVLRFESNGQFPAYPYQLLGIDLNWHGMLNWPLHDHIVRTPYNPLPTFAMWPLALADHFGLVALALMVFGLGRMLLARRSQAVFWLLWFAPTWLALSLQEAWDYQNKMGIAVIVLAAPVAWLVAGTRGLFRQPRIGVPATVGLLIVALLSLPALRTWEVPADTRYLDLYHLERGESAEAVAAARAEVTDVAAWPDIGRMTSFGRFMGWPQLTALGAGLRAPIRTIDRNSNGLVWGWHRHEIPQPGVPVTIEIDLSRPPFGRDDFVRLSDQPAEIDLDTDPSVHLVSPVTATWESQPLSIALARPGGATAIQTFFGVQVGPGRDRAFSPCTFREHPCSCEFFGDVSGLPPTTTCAGHTAVGATSPVLRVRTRAGVLTLVVTTNVYGNRGWLWRGRISSDGVELMPAVRLWHN